MQATVEFDQRQLWRYLDQARDALAAEMRSSLDITVQTIAGAVRMETPVGVSGNLRQSIYGEVYGQPLTAEFAGVVGTPLIYGDAVENGTRAHWPPSGALELWVTRKLGISGAEAADVAFLVARKISKRGTRPGQRMFERGLANATPAIERYWQTMPARVKARVTNG